MSGILNKKNRMLDYILTENGRKQIQNGDIRFRYYSFSDSSIVYQSSNVESDYKISDSEFYYLPFEPSTDPLNYVNPEIDLSDEVDFSFVFDDTLNILESKTKIQDFNARNSITDQLIKRKYLDTEDSLNLSRSNPIEFKLKTIMGDINFKKHKDELQESTRQSIINYLTINKAIELTGNLPSVTKDSRFSHKINNKKLIPTNLDGSEIIEDNQGTETIYQNNSYFSFRGSLENERISNYISLINELKRLSKEEIFKSKYEIYKDNVDDTFITELHEVSYEDLGLEDDKLTINDTLIEGEVYKIKAIDQNSTYEFWEILGYKDSNNEIPEIDDVFTLKKIPSDAVKRNLGNSKFKPVNKKLKKLAFVHLGEHFDESSKKNVSIYMIGKFIINRHNNESSSYDEETKIIKREINTDYTFVNLFTMTVEQ